MDKQKKNARAAMSLGIALLLFAMCARAWVIALPEGTAITIPIRGISVEAVSQPLPGDGTTDTMIDLSFNRTVSVNTNGVTGTVLVTSSFRVAVPRASIEALTGLPIGQAKHADNTNAVARVAYARLMSSLSVLSEELTEP